MDTPVTVEGVSVTLIDANHCPGAVLFLFRTKAPPGSEHPMQARRWIFCGGTLCLLSCWVVSAHVWAHRVPRSHARSQGVP